MPKYKIKRQIGIILSLEQELTRGHRRHRHLHLNKQLTGCRSRKLIWGDYCYETFIVDGQGECRHNHRRHCHFYQFVQPCSWSRGWPADFARLGSDFISKGKRDLVGKSKKLRRGDFHLLDRNDSQPYREPARIDGLDFALR